MSEIHFFLDDWVVDWIVDEISSALASSHSEHAYLEADADELAKLTSDYLNELDRLENYACTSDSIKQAIDKLVELYNELNYYQLTDEVTLGFKLLKQFMAKPLRQVHDFLKPCINNEKRLRNLANKPLTLDYETELENIRLWLEEFQELRTLEAAGLINQDKKSGFGKIAAAFALGWWLGGG